MLDMRQTSSLSMDPVKTLSQTLDLLKTIGEKAIGNLLAQPLSALLSISNSNELWFPIITITIMALLYSAWAMFWLGSDAHLAAADGILESSDQPLEANDGPLEASDSVDTLGDNPFMVLSDFLGETVGEMLGNPKGKSRAAVKKEARAVAQRAARIRRTPWYQHFIKGLFYGFIVYHMATRLALGIPSSVTTLRPAVSGFKGYKSYSPTYTSRPPVPPRIPHAYSAPSRSDAIPRYQPRTSYVPPAPSAYTAHPPSSTSGPTAYCRSR